MAECIVCKQEGSGQCSKCHTVWYCSVKCQKQNWPSHKLACRPQKNEDRRQDKQKQKPLQPTSDQIEKLTIIIREYVNIYKIIYVIDQIEADRFKQRNEYYFNIAHHNHSHQDNQSEGTKHKCCSVSFNKIYSPKQQQSIYELHLDQLLSTASLKGGLLAEIINTCGKNFFNIKNNGIKQGLPWDDQNQVYLLAKVMEQGLLHFFVNKLKAIISQNQKINSKQPMLYANAATWKAKYPEIQLNFLNSNFLQRLCTKGYAVQKNYIQNQDYLRGQLNWIEKDGRFQQNILQADMRNDRHLWISSVEQKEFPWLFRLIKYMSALQFEISTKTNLSCSISQMYMLSYFKSSGFHKKHQDSSQTNDTGKKLSVLVSLQKIEVVLYSEEDNKQISIILQPRDLLILKSRIYSYELKCQTSKTFLIRYWINGPKQSQLQWKS